MRSSPTLRLAGLALACSAAAACESLAAPPPEDLGLRKEAAGAVESVKLAELCRDVWEQRLRDDPFEATYLGDPRFHGRIPDRSRVGREHMEQARRQLLLRARIMKEEPLTDADRVTLAIVEDTLERELRELSLALDEWTVDPVRSITTEILNLAAYQPHETRRQRQQLMDRWNLFPSYIRQSSENLRLAKLERRVSSASAVREVIEQVDAVLDTPPMDSALVAPALGGGRWVELPAGSSLHSLAYRELGDGRRQRDLRLLNLHLREGERVMEGTRVLMPSPDDPLSLKERGEFLYEVLTTVEREIYPALAAYRDTLAEAIAPAARPDAKPGLVHLYRGAELYEVAIQNHTTLELTAEKIHELGLSEVERIRGEIAKLGGRHFGTTRVAEIQERLRSDPALHFDTREEVLAKATEAVARATRRLPDYFGILPLTGCEVLPIPPHEEAHSTIAYYRPPAPDGSRPGRYYVNTHAPKTRPRYDAEVLAYHEAVPGHHLQIAIAQELEGLPLIRRHVFHTAFGEGWALYIERLADEMGLYSSDLDRFGVLSFDAWRAARLVVDTGLHHEGWSREQAIDYLYENTLLARNNCENEVDRYIAWPGQALAYKIGQREILRLRERAQEALGGGFSYPAFHDCILGEGSVPLPLLQERVEAWIAASAPPR